MTENAKRWNVLLIILKFAQSIYCQDEEEHHSNFKINHRMGKMKIKANPGGADFEFSGGDLDVDIKPAHNFAAPIHNEYHDTYYNTEPHHEIEGHHEEVIHSGFMPPHELINHEEFHGEEAEGPHPHDYQPLPINVFFHHPVQESEEHMHHFEEPNFPMNEPNFHVVEPVHHEEMYGLNHHGYARHLKRPHNKHKKHRGGDIKHTIYPSDEAMSQEAVYDHTAKGDITESEFKSIVPSDSAIANSEGDASKKSFLETYDQSSGGRSIDNNVISSGQSLDNGMDRKVNKRDILLAFFNLRRPKKSN